MSGEMDEEVADGQAEEKASGHSRRLGCHYLLPIVTDTRDVECLEGGNMLHGELFSSCRLD